MNHVPPVDQLVTYFVLDDFGTLTNEERQALAEDPHERYALAKPFLEGLGWSEIADIAVDVWRENRA